MGRAARNSNGHVILYADRVTDSMAKAIGETERRRDIQRKYNEEHGITPTTIKKEIRDVIRATAVSRRLSSADMHTCRSSIGIPHSRFHLLRF